MDNFATASYIGCGCNKSPQILDWGENNLICFGVCNAIAIYDPVEGRIKSSLTEHSDNVNAVKWLRGRGHENELVSASTDSRVIVWLMKCKKTFIFEAVSTLTDHEGSVHAVDGRYNDSGTILASASSDSTVRLWFRKNDEDFACISVINLERSIAFCLDILVLENNKSSLLSFGTDVPELIFYSVGDSSETVKQLLKVHGHEDWIRSVSMKSLKNGDIFVASSGQDMIVRIHRLSQLNTDRESGSFYLKKEELFIGDLKYYLSLETVLFGHEGWIYSVDWSHTSDDDACSLLTSSFDRTVVVWKPCPDSDVWIEESRMGELGGDNSLGYYGGKFSPDSKSVIAHSYQGSFHIWKKDGDKWVADFTLGGHSDAVMDISWEKNGKYLLSVSSDKTTRLHAPCLKGKTQQTVWCEMSRPQIHGHALSSVASMRNLSFASCSEEKVVRVFEMPDAVLKLINTFCDTEILASNQIISSMPAITASINALGLSNKAVYENSNSNSNVPISNSNINEDFLVQHTLWPESMKLYGHGNDVFTIAASNDSKLLATAAKATNSDQASILLWDTETWKIVGKLAGHQLTITQMEFSPTDSFLLSVSRDRKWCLFKRNENNKFELEAVPEKNIHSRIIWSCGWSHDENYFVTGSRDCKVIVWKQGKPVNNIVSSKGSATAVAFAPLVINKEKYLIAVGHECGVITIYWWCVNGWSLINSISKYLGHHLTVQRLQFRPIDKNKKQPEERSVLQLASCSIDHSVRIFDMCIEHLRKVETNFL